MSSYEIQEYIALYEFLKTPSDESVVEQVKIKMERLWYFHLTPKDKQIIFDYIKQQGDEYDQENC